MDNRQIQLQRRSQELCDDESVAIKEFKIAYDAIQKEIQGHKASILELEVMFHLENSSKIVKWLVVPNAPDNL